MAPSLSGMKIGVMQTQHDPAGISGTRMIDVMGKIWTSWGAELECIWGLPDHMPEVDLLIPHLDLTVVPKEYRALLAEHPNVLNRDVLDISKRRISTNLVDRDSDWRGPVIVKTNLNFGGIPERLLADAGGGNALNFGRARRPWRRLRTLHPEKYEVFQTVREVPYGVWRNEHLVVEKFMPERDGEYFCMRISLVLGERSYSKRLYATGPVVKASNIVRVEYKEMPSDLQEIRTRFGLQFGKLDYVKHDGRTQLFDLNKTPGAPPDTDPANPTNQDLALGILPFLGL